MVLVFNMPNLIPILSTILPIIASSLLIIVVSISFYFKVRRRFPVNVNCWFCNSWTKVPYDEKDGFNCPTCLQYNGFNKDGSYNKIIPEQHDELMNKATRTKNHSNIHSNGLCALCNNNQQLKIFQLANFVPMVEQNYDREIEHFQEQLEKAYKLCKKCDKVLNTTLQHQSAWIFGNRVKNLRQNGVAFIKSHLSKTRGSIIFNIINFLSVFMAILVLFICVNNLRIFTRTVAKYAPRNYAVLLKNFTAALNTPITFEFNFLDYFTKNVKVEAYTSTCIVALLLQIVSFFDKYQTTIKFNRLLCWVSLILTSWIRLNRKYMPYIFILQTFCCVYVIYTSLTKSNNSKTNSPQKVKGKLIRKFVKNLETTCSDLSETSDFEDISSSSKKLDSSTSSSSDYKSTYPNQQFNLTKRNFNTATSVLNSNLSTANCSFTTAKSNFDKDLNQSLNNLHLSGLNMNPSRAFSPPMTRPRPVLSPPKLQTCNSWVAGGFWKNPDGIVLPMSRNANISRSSSESSGFGSQHNDNLQFCNDFEKTCPKMFQFQPPQSNYVFSPIQSPQPQAYFHPNTVYSPFSQRDVFVPGTSGLLSPALSMGYPYSNNLPYQRRGLFKNLSESVHVPSTQNYRNVGLNHSN